MTRNEQINNQAQVWPVLETGPPIVSGGLAVYPVAEDGEAPEDYDLLQEAIAKGAARVTEITEGGSVPILMLHNLADFPILAIQGEEMVGAKQDRTLNVSFLAAPGKTEVPVTCVEHGRWGYQARNFSSGSMEHHDLRRMKAEQVSASLKEPSRRGMERYMADQGAVWNEVAETSARHGVASHTGDLKAVFAAAPVKEQLEGVTGGIELPENTRGAVFAIDGKIVAAEIFESARVLSRIWPRLIQSYAMSSLGNRGEQKKSEAALPPQADAARFLGRPCDLEATTSESVGIGEDLRWDDKDVLAAGLAYKGRLLHATVYARRQPPRSVRPWPRWRRA
jgi:hypothetical protein